MNARLVLGCVLATGALLTGCQTDIPGKPVAGTDSPTEPDFPTARPTVSRPPSSTPAPPPGSAPGPSPTVGAPPGAQVLRPQNGYVFIETKSGKTRCQLTSDAVGCEAQFTNSPVVDGFPANGVRLSADGDLRWLVGNLGDIPAVRLDYRTYTAVGWTIEASSAGTRFTNERTGRGMSVSVESVQAF